MNIVDWIHPSYRDLIIEELAADSSLRRMFLLRMGLEGIKLAIKDVLDQTGEKKLLLLQTEDSWHILQERCEELVRSGSNHEIVDLFRVLTNAIDTTDTNIKTRLLNIIRLICDAVRMQWNSNREHLSAQELEAYCQASIYVEPLPPIPDLTNSWDFAVNGLKDHIEAYMSGELIDPNEIEEWLDLLYAIKRNEPRFFKQVLFPEKYSGSFVQLLEAVEEELKYTYNFNVYEELDEEAERLSALADLLPQFVEFYPRYASQLHKIVKVLERKSNELRNEAAQLAPIDPDDDYDWRRESALEFDIDALFEDL